MSGIQKDHDALRGRYDAVVIGSGYGGGVAACRLARMGLSVAVLEKGRAWRPGDFDNRLRGLLRRMRLSGRRFKWGRDNALFDVRLGRDIHVLAGCGLGGGSLVNAGLAFRPDDAVFRRAGWPAELLANGYLEAGFERASRMLGVADCPTAGELAKYNALVRAAETLGATAELVPSTINYRPGANRANVVQPACSLCGDCWMGCNTGAKNTVANTYLVDAADHGAEIFTGVAANLVRRSGTFWQLDFDRLDDRTGRRIATGSLTAGLVVVAAGVFGTTDILMRSRERGLTLSDRLGKGVSANGDDVAFGHDLPFPVDGVAVGYPRRSQTAGPVGPNCLGMFRLAGARVEEAISIQAGTMPHVMSVLAPLTSLARGRLVRAWNHVSKGPYEGPLRHSQTYYVVGHDSAGGELSLRRGRLVLDWPGVGDEPVFTRARDSLMQLVTRLGGEYVTNPVRGRLFGGKPITVHPLGGCAMAATATDGVVDHQGRVFDNAAGESATVHDGLYVIDGSIIPTSLGANPLLTIAALAERAMQLLAAERGLPLSDDPEADSPLRDALM